MDKKPVDYFTPQEVADHLKISRRTVYRYISTGKLKVARPGGRLLRISEQDLALFLMPPNPKSSVAITKREAETLNRRELLRNSVGFVATIFASSAAGVAADRVWEDYTLRNEALDLFKGLFGSSDTSRTFDHLWGRPTYWDDFHPYNKIAGRILKAPLIPVDNLHITAPSHLTIPPQRRGDIVVLGGPNSTTETMVAWEFEGDDFRHLTRRRGPLIDLRWHSGSSEVEHYVPRDYKISYGMGFGRTARTSNWPLFDKTRDESKVPKPGTLVSNGDGLPAYLPGENYLLITSLYNFLDPNFDALMETTHESRWPRLLVFDGTHGPGTSGVHLLFDEEAPDILRSVRHELRGEKDFQVLFTLGGLQPTSGGLHKFTKVLDFETHPLAVDQPTYREAHRYATRRLKELDG